MSNAVGTMQPATTGAKEAVWPAPPVKGVTRG